MNQQVNTPAWVDSIIDNLAPTQYAEEIRGDLYELYIKDLEHLNIRKANVNYALNAFGFLFKSFFWKRSTDINPIFSAMLTNYFKMAWRSLNARKTNTVINVLGLVIGIASAMVIFTVIRFELSFDTFHSNAKNIYRVVRVSGADMSEYRTGISYPVPVALKAEIPSLYNITSVEYFGGANVDVLDEAGESISRFREESGCALIEPSFFKVFDFNNTGFRWISGNPEKALVEPMTVVITESAGKKYFGDKDPIGRTLQFQKRFDCKVTGVVTDLPPNSDFPFTIMVSHASLQILNSNLNDWISVNDSHNTFVVLNDGTTKEEMEQQIAKVHAAHTPKELHEMRHYLLQPLADMHFDPKFGNFNRRTITRQTLIGLGVVAAFLLLTGSINYINLATAQASLRAREIGLRKVMGSRRKNLMLQFLAETFVVVLAAGIFAIALGELLLINLQALLNVKLEEFNFTSPETLGYLAVIVVVVTLLSGIYPSLIISGFNPVSALKNKFSTEKLGGLALRKVLVVLQFTITQILVVGTFIVVSQMQFFQHVDMGFNKDAIITARIPDTETPRFEVLEQKLRAQSFVSNVSFSYTLPSGASRNRSYMDIGRSDASAMKDYIVFEYAAIDPSFLDLYEIKLLAGRNLTEADTTGAILINKSLAKNLQFKTPEEAVGHDLKIGGDKVTVVGIVNDYYSNSLKEGVDNIVMLIKPFNYATLSVKLNTDGVALKDATDEVNKIWTSVYPEFVFNYSYFDENIKAFYSQEDKYAKLFQMFSITFLIIGCLGLYGLITFVVNQKSKEVAIRKVLGATLTNILTMFSREYVQLILISFCIAVPVAYYLVHDWLSNFAHHIELKWWLFAIPGILVLVIAMIVIGTKSLRAAQANPVDKLKYE